jgi:hypothetical protein
VVWSDHLSRTDRLAKSLASASILLCISHAAAQTLSGSQANEVLQWLKEQQTRALQLNRFEGFGLQYEVLIPPPTQQMIDAAEQQHREVNLPETKRMLDWYRKSAAEGRCRAQMAVYLDGPDRWRFNRASTPWTFQDIVYTENNSWEATEQAIVLYGPGGAPPPGTGKISPSYAKSGFIGQIPQLFFGVMGTHATLPIATVRAEGDNFEATLATQGERTKAIRVKVTGNRRGAGGTWQTEVTVVMQHDEYPVLVGRRTTFGATRRFENYPEPVHTKYDIFDNGTEFLMGIDSMSIVPLPPGGFDAVITRPDRSLEIPLRGKLSGNVNFVDVQSGTVETSQEGKLLNAQPLKTSKQAASLGWLNVFGWSVLGSAVLLFVILRSKNRA